MEEAGIGAVPHRSISSVIRVFRQEIHPRLEGRGHIARSRTFGRTCRMQVRPFCIISPHKRDLYHYSAGMQAKFWTDVQVTNTHN